MISLPAFPAPRGYALFAIFLCGAVVNGCANEVRYLDICLMVSNVPGTSITACSFSSWMGFFSWVFGLCSLLFMLTSYYNVDREALTAKCEFVMGAIWSFLWFVCFCIGCAAWRKAPKCAADGVLCSDNHIASNANSVLAFGFFSICAWGALSFFGFKRYKFGGTSAGFANSDYVQDTSGAGYQAEPASENPYQTPGGDADGGAIAEI